MKLTVNGEERTVADVATALDLLNALGIEAGRVAVEVNLEVVPRAALGRHALHDGDRVEIVSFVGGG